MSTRMRRLGLTIAVTTLITGLAWAGQPMNTPPNWDQVDRTSPWTCPTPSGTTGDWFTLPDFDASLTTTGGPVLLSLTLTVSGLQHGSAFWLSPVVDDQRQPQRMDWQTVGGVDTITVQRVYPLPAGTYSFEVAMSCQFLVEVTRGWLTVYELPSSRR
jgi:hypothetical protein